MTGRLRPWLGRSAGSLFGVVGLTTVVGFFALTDARAVGPPGLGPLVAALCLGVGAILLALSRAAVPGGLLAFAGGVGLGAKPILFPLTATGYGADEVLTFSLTSETHLWFLVPAFALLVLGTIVLSLGLVPWPARWARGLEIASALTSSLLCGLFGLLLGLAFFGSEGSLASALTRLAPGVLLVVLGAAQGTLGLGALLGGTSRPQVEAPAATPGRAAPGTSAFDGDSIRTLLEAIAYAPGGAASLGPGEADPLVGLRLDRFVLEARIGAGGMGVVYRARDERLGRPVALKLVRPSLSRRQDLRARLMREARAAARLSHPSIVRVHDVCESELGPFIVMELVTGVSLRERLAEGPLGPEEATRIASRVASALVAAHELGVVHRDLKPENVVVTPGGGVKVLDFGLARLEGQLLDELVDATGATLTREGQILGTPAYMSPEQACGDPVDARTDLFSFGSLVLEMLTGRAPFARPTVQATCDALRRGEVPQELWGAVAGPLVPLLARCLEPDRERRPASARELESALSALVSPARAGSADPEVEGRHGSS